jgi:hypothetical protein
MANVLKFSISINRMKTSATQFLYDEETWRFRFTCLMTSAGNNIWSFLQSIIMLVHTNTYHKNKIKNFVTVVSFLNSTASLLTDFNLVYQFCKVFYFFKCQASLIINQLKLLVVLWVINVLVFKPIICCLKVKKLINISDVNKKAVKTFLNVSHYDEHSNYVLCIYMHETCNNMNQ